MTNPGLERFIRSFRLWATGCLCGAWAAQLMGLFYGDRSLNYLALALCIACGLAAYLLLWHLVLDPLFYRVTRRTENELASVVFLSLFIALIGTSQHISVAITVGLVLALLVGRQTHRAAKDNIIEAKMIIVDMLRKSGTTFVVLASVGSLVISLSESSFFSRGGDALALLFLLIGAAEGVQILRDKSFGLTTLALLLCSLLATNLESSLDRMWNRSAESTDIVQSKEEVAQTLDQDFQPKRHSLPRIILITIDTLRADALSCYGSSNHTPAVDDLASTSLLYETAIAPSPWTLPSLVSILTGFEPSQHGVVEDHSKLPETMLTLGDVLMQEGYFTAFIGWNHYLKKGRGIDGGFLNYQIDFAADRDTTKPISERVIQFLTRQADLDFFLWVHFFDPHLVYNPPAPWAPTEPQLVDFQRRFPRTEDIRAGYVQPTAEQMKWTKQLYLAEVRYVDQKIGQITKTLRELDLFDDALIILSSDHGEEFWEHGGFEHGHSLHHEVLHVPLLVKQPKQKTNQRIGQPVSLARIFPTVLAHAEIQATRPTTPPLPTSVEKTFQPIMSGHMRYYQPQRSLYFDTWKYIQQISSQHHQLYDLRSDPAEHHSAAGSQPDIIQKAKRLLAEIEKQAAETHKNLVPDAAPPMQLDTQTEEQLRSLGYVR